MRSFEQRIAEISRRSKKIIQERKRMRCHVLAGCVPLALCVGFGAVVALPEIVSNETSDGTAGETYAMMSESVNCSVTRVQVVGEGISRTCTEPSQILYIAQFLDSLTVHYASGSAESGTNGEDRKMETEAATEETDGITYTDTNLPVLTCTITLTLGEGGSVEYCLTGSVLEDRTGQQTYVLSEQELLTLQALLGLLQEEAGSAGP